MEKNERLKYQKKKALYKKLGAKKFQKVVFAVEKAKFKVLKTICPNFIKYFDKYCDIKQKLEIKKAKTDEDKKAIIKNYKIIKMNLRKEFYSEKNMNYHINSANPTEIYSYLEWNKSVHKIGLIKNSIFIPILIIGIALGFTVPATILLISELISLGINFECINIQNYNMSRYKLSEEKIKKKYAEKMQENVENYGIVSEVISKEIEKSEKLPSFDQIIASATDKEALIQFKEMLKKEQRDRQLNRAKTYCKGE